MNDSDPDVSSSAALQTDSIPVEFNQKPRPKKLLLSLDDQ